MLGIKESSHQGTILPHSQASGRWSNHCDLQVSQWCQAVQREDPDPNGWVQKWPKCMGISVFSPQFSDKQNVGVFPT